MSVVIDCSVTIAWFFGDESSAYADRVLDAIERDAAVAPFIWTLETANVLIVAERRGRITSAESAKIAALLEALPIQVLVSRRSDERRELIALGREHALSAYDAAYLGLAMQLGLPLATTDARLRQACARAGVALLD